MINACGKLNPKKPQADIGEYRGFSLKLQFDPLNRKFHAVLKHEAGHSCELGLDAVGNITRLDNLLDSVPGQLEDARANLETMNRQVEESKEELKKTFPQEQELAEKSERLNRLTLELDGSRPHKPEKEEKESLFLHPFPTGLRKRRKIPIFQRKIPPPGSLEKKNSDIETEPQS